MEEDNKRPDIKLGNRYGKYHTLKFIKEQNGYFIYEFHSYDPFFDDHIRMAKKPKAKTWRYPDMIDPDGGPYMSIGNFWLDGMVLKKIKCTKGNLPLLYFV